MKNILIVDDQAGWRKFNTQAVYSVLGNDIIVKTASSAMEAYNLLLENLAEPFDYVLTDMQMEDDYLPKMAGEWLIEQARGIVQYKGVKITIISASMQSKHIAEHYGVNFIPKSVAATSLDSYKEIFD